MYLVSGMYLVPSHLVISLGNRYATDNIHRYSNSIFAFIHRAGVFASLKSFKIEYCFHSLLITLCQTYYCCSVKFSFMRTIDTYIYMYI